MLLDTPFLFLVICMPARDLILINLSHYPLSLLFQSAEAIEAAKQMLEQSPPRIELDVELLAPLLLLPRLSASTDVLIFDLGELIYPSLHLTFSGLLSRIQRWQNLHCSLI